MPIEVEGQVVEMKDFYPDVRPAKGTKRVLFKRWNFAPFKRIVQSLDAGPNQDPIPQWNAMTVNKDSGGIMIPLHFTAVTDYRPGANKQDSSTQNVRYYDTKTKTGVGNTQVEQFTGDELWIRGAGHSLDVTTPKGIQIYVLLSISPHNAANAKRYGTREPLFEMVDVEGENKQRNEVTRARNKAIGLAFDEEKVPNSLALTMHKELAAFLNNGNATEDLKDREDWETLRGDLALYASSKPAEFEKLVNDANSNMRAEVRKAIEKKIITQDGKRWMWGNIKGVKNKKEFAVIPVGQDPVQELMNHFQTKTGRPDMIFMLKELESLDE